MKTRPVSGPAEPRCPQPARLLDPRSAQRGRTAPPASRLPRPVDSLSHVSSLDSRPLTLDGLESAFPSSSSWRLSSPGRGAKRGASLRPVKEPEPTKTSEHPAAAPARAKRPLSSSLLFSHRSNPGTRWWWEAHAAFASPKGSRPRRVSRGPRPPCLVSPRRHFCCPGCPGHPPLLSGIASSPVGTGHQPRDTLGGKNGSEPRGEKADD